VKFSCERCGKKYATADQPVPGRVYKLKCKACGHLIVVKGAAAAGAAPSPERTPDVAVEIGNPEALRPTSTPPPVNGAPAGATTELRLPRGSETQELPAPTPTPGLALAPPPAPEPVVGAPRAEDEFTPPPGDTGYVDLFADAPAGADAAASAPPSQPDDPFFAAARSSLPDGYGGPAADPFGAIRAELEAAAAGDAPRGAEASPPLPTPKMPDIPRPPVQKQGAPIALIGAGVLVMLAILAFALLRTGGKSPAPATRATPAVASAPVTPPPVRAPPPQPEPQPSAVEEKAPEAPPAAAPDPEPAAVATAAPARAAPKPARVERPDRRRPERKPEPRPEPRAEKVVAAAPRPAAEPTAPEPPPRQEAQVELPETPEGLSQDQIQKVLASTRKAFDGCVASAGKDSNVALDGRRVALRLNIQPNGTVTYPTLDDVTLNATSLGACLKNSARLMVFPKFRGDPVRIEVPLTLAAR
jgi:DNA-directed RNA polymerase subunit RPC12/RpoP